jgi:hypothetical protein
MTTLNATRKLMRVKDDGSKVKMTFDVQINCTTGLIAVNGQPVGYGDQKDGLGYVSVYEHFSLMESYAKPRLLLANGSLSGMYRELATRRTR